MVCIASTWVMHMLTSIQMRISIESTSKFLRLNAEDLTYLNRVVTCDETRVHHYDPLTKGKWALEEEKWTTREKCLAAEVGVQGHINCVLWPLGASALCVAKDDHQQEISPESLEDLLAAY